MSPTIWGPTGGDCCPSSGSSGSSGPPYGDCTDACQSESTPAQVAVDLRTFTNVNCPKNICTDFNALHILDQVAPCTWEKETLLFCDDGPATTYLFIRFWITWSHPNTTLSVGVWAQPYFPWSHHTFTKTIPGPIDCLSLIEEVLTRIYNDTTWCSAGTCKVSSLY